MVILDGQVTIYGNLAIEYDHIWQSDHTSYFCSVDIRLGVRLLDRTTHTTGQDYTEYWTELDGRFL